MQHLKWTALPVLALGLVVLFFGLIWTAAVQLAVGVALAGLATAIWRVTSGTWPLTHT